MKVGFFISILLLVFSSPSLGGVTKKVSSNSYYNSTLLGESDFQHYLGPLAPDFSQSPDGNGIEFRDDVYINRYFEGLTSGEISSWQRTWFEEFPMKASCPNYFLNSNIDYIRYLFRLLTISYHYEVLKSHNDLAYKLGVKLNKCSLDWKKVFKGCRPKSIDMKRFMRRVKHKIIQGVDKRSYVKLNKIQLKEWVAKFKAGKSNGNDLSVTFIKEWGGPRELSSGDFKLPEVRKGLSNLVRRFNRLLNYYAQKKITFTDFLTLQSQLIS